MLIKIGLTELRYGDIDATQDGCAGGINLQSSIAAWDQNDYMYIVSTA